MFKTINSNQNKFLIHIKRSALHATITVTIKTTTVINTPAIAPALALSSAAVGEIPPGGVVPIVTGSVGKDVGGGCIESSVHYMGYTHC